MYYKKFRKPQSTDEFVEAQLARLARVERDIERYSKENSSLNDSLIQNLHLTANTIKASLGADTSTMTERI